jgi:hypothetical protein
MELTQWQFFGADEFKWRAVRIVTNGDKRRLDVLIRRKIFKQLPRPRKIYIVFQRGLPGYIRVFIFIE